MTGILASASLKIDYKTRQATTLKSILGAFLLTRDAIDKGGTERSKRTMKDSGKAANLDGIDSRNVNNDSVLVNKVAKKNVTPEYAMLALARNDQIPCISCGYPTLRGFGPEKHHRFDRMLTCSQGCWYTHAHYKDMDEVSLQTKTVKTVTESIQAACAYVIKTIRSANGEEVKGGTATETQEAANHNADNLTMSFINLMTCAWNGVRIGWTLNDKLGKTQRFRSLVPNIPVMGHVIPQFIKKTTIAKSCSSVLLTLGEKVDRDVMRKVDMEKVIRALGIDTKDMGTPAETSDLQQEFLLLKNEVETLKKEISMKDEGDAKKDEEIKVLRSDLQNCRDQLLSKAAIGVQNGEALHLKSELDALKKKITDLRKEMAIRNLEIETKNVEIETLKQKCEILQLEKAVAIEKCSVEMKNLKPAINTVDLTNAPIDEKGVAIETCSVEMDELKSKDNIFDLTYAHIEPKSKGNVLDLTANTDQHGVYFQLKGLHYIVKDVVGDGSCLFHSLAKITLIPFSTGSDVRDAIVSYLVEGKAGDIIAKDDELKALRVGTTYYHGLDINGWASNMKNNTWGSTWETAILAVMCGIEIITVTYLTPGLDLITSKETLRMMNCKELYEEFTEDRVTFYLLHHSAGSPGNPGEPKNFNHFAYLEEVDDETSIPIGAKIIRDKQKSDTLTATTQTPTETKESNTNSSSMPMEAEETNTKQKETMTCGLIGAGTPQPSEVPRNKVARREALLNEILKRPEGFETACFINCAECNTSIDRKTTIMVPNEGSEALTYLGHTPKSIREHALLKEHFGERLRDLTNGDWESICYWPSNWIEVIVVLLCHVFHCPGVQCFIVENLDENFKVITLRQDVETLLGLVHKAKHYGVIEVALKTRKVVIYDAARKESYSIVKHWRQHVIYALKKHLPSEVLPMGENVVYANASTMPVVPDKTPLWKLEGHVGGYYQNDNFTCGPNGVNRFASRLKSLSGGIVSDDGINAHVKTPEELEKLGESNVTHVKHLFEFLLKRKHDVFIPMEDKMAEQTKQGDVKDNNQIGTHIQSIREGDEGLFDTPENKGLKALSLAKRLRKVGESKANCDTILHLSETIAKAKGNDRHIGAASNGGDEDHLIGAAKSCGGRDSQIGAAKGDGDGEAKDEWTKEEEELVEYGCKRAVLKRNGVRKKHVDNLAKVSNIYPGLKGTMEFICTAGRCTVDEIAEAIRGVPMFGSPPLMDKEEMKSSDIFGPPEEIPDDCEYEYIERDCALLNEELRNRSKKLYDDRKKEEVKPLKILKCFVHGRKTVLEMSK